MPLPNIGSMDGNTGRSEGATAEKAVPFPCAVLDPNRSFVELRVGEPRPGARSVSSPPTAAGIARSYELYRSYAPRRWCVWQASAHQPAGRGAWMIPLFGRSALQVRVASRICAAPLRAHGASTQQPPGGSPHLAHARRLRARERFRPSSAGCGSGIWSTTSETQRPSAETRRHAAPVS
jgi:hypothetical protein